MINKLILLNVSTKSKVDRRWTQQRLAQQSYTRQTRTGLNRNAWTHCLYSQQLFLRMVAGVCTETLWKIIEDIIGLDSSGSQTETDMRHEMQCLPINAWGMKYRVRGDRCSTRYGFGSYRFDSYCCSPDEELSNSLVSAELALLSLTVAVSALLPKCIMLWPPRPKRMMLWLWAALLAKLSSPSKSIAILKQRSNLNKSPINRKSIQWFTGYMKHWLYI